MRNSIMITGLSFYAAGAFAQNPDQQRPVTPLHILKETLCEARTMSDVLYDVYQYKDYVLNWTKNLSYTSVKVIAGSEGNETAASGEGGDFTSSQTGIFRNAEPGSKISFNVVYRERPSGLSDASATPEEKRMQIQVTVTPARAAEFPGGYGEMISYLRKSVFDALGSGSQQSAEVAKKLELTTVRFIVDEAGQVNNANIERSSQDEAIDKLVLDAVRKMPRWNSAANAKGAGVKEILSVSLNPNGGGC